VVDKRKRRKRRKMRRNDRKIEIKDGNQVTSKDFVVN